MKTALTIGALFTLLISVPVYAQTKNTKAPRTAQAEPVVSGGAWLMGRVISRDPDPHVRAAMLRDYSGIGAYHGTAKPGARECNK